VTEQDAGKAHSGLVKVTGHTSLAGVTEYPCDSADEMRAMLLASGCVLSRTG
jgi:hypothetical protein